jgi:hypothetical protein
LNGLYARSPFDLFYLDEVNGLASNDPIVSGKLKAALEEEGVEGCTLVELKHFTVDAG